MIGMGLGFEMPVVLLTLVRLGVLDYQKLRSMRRYMFVICLVLGAVLTTPEVVTQIDMQMRITQRAWVRVTVDGVEVSDYDALFVTGGQSPMVTFRGDVKLQKLVADFYEAGKITALVCHGTCLLLETKLSSGKLLVEGKTWTGFANSEEQFADGFVGTRIQPFWIEDEARRIPGTNFVVDQMFRDFAVRDGRLVTGQQQFSGAAAARLVIEAPAEFRFEGPQVLHLPAGRLAASAGIIPHSASRTPCPLSWPHIPASPRHSSPASRLISRPSPQPAA